MASDLAVTVVNPASAQAVIYVGGPAATLDLTLTNHTGAPIGLQNAAGAASSLAIRMPEMFTSGQVGTMTVTPMAGWRAAVDGASHRLTLTFTGSDGTAWADGQALTFAIANVLATASPTSGPIRVEPRHMTGPVPLEVQATLNLNDPPRPGNASLRDTLAVGLDAAVVYVSADGDPLWNTLRLTLTNTGPTPLYVGAAMWTGRPVANVSFVYGTTAGALAGASDRSAPATGSAWNIAGSVQVSEGNDWGVTPPDVHGANPPLWTLAPATTNRPVIGAPPSEAATFAFGSIVSFTPAGTTLMNVQLTGFRRDEHTAYDDAVWVLPIEKLAPPPTRGISAFNSTLPSSTITVTSPTDVVTVPLAWTMCFVASVQLSWGGGSTALFTNTYPRPVLSATDHTSVSIPYAQIFNAVGSSRLAPVTFTLTALDGRSGVLPSPQFTAFVDAQWRVLGFTSGGPSLSGTTVIFPLSWTMFSVSSVTLTSSMAGVSPTTRTYTPQLTASDTIQLEVPYAQVVGLPSVAFSLQSFDGRGLALNTLHVTVALGLQSVTGTTFIRTYPGITSLRVSITWTMIGAGSVRVTSRYAQVDTTFTYPQPQWSDSQAIHGTLPDGWDSPSGAVTVGFTVAAYDPNGNPLNTLGFNVFVWNGVT